MIITTNKIPRKEPTQIKTTGTGETVLVVWADVAVVAGDVVEDSSSATLPEQKNLSMYYLLMYLLFIKLYVIDGTLFAILFPFINYSVHLLLTLSYQIPNLN